MKKMKPTNVVILSWIVLNLITVGIVRPVPAAAGDATVIRVAAMGDIMLGTVGHLPADEGAGSFKAVKKYLEGADIIFGNHEGALSDIGACTKKGDNPYCFRIPTSYARWLKEAGFNMMSIANNHSGDFGPAAKQQTMDTMKKNGIGYSGPPGTVARLTVHGVRTAMAAFYTGSGSHKFNDVPKAKSIVAGLAKDNDIVIVSFHAGAEGRNAAHVKPGSESFMGENRGDVIAFSRAVVDAGADLVIGHGPHVPRAMEVYKGRLIAYSLGNFCTGERISVQGISGYAPLLLAELAPDGKLTGGRIVGFTQAYAQHPRFDPDNKAGKLIHQLGEEDLPKSNAVGPDGKLVIPGK